MKCVTFIQKLAPAILLAAIGCGRSADLGREAAQKRVGEPKGVPPAEEMIMAKGQKKSNKEARKPKAAKVKTNAAQASAKPPVGLVNIKD